MRNEAASNIADPTVKFGRPNLRADCLTERAAPSSIVPGRLARAHMWQRLCPGLREFRLEGPHNHAGASFIRTQVKSISAESDLYRPDISGRQ